MMDAPSSVKSSPDRHLCGRWAGLDLRPMLHESVYSVLSRFAQRNVLDFGTLSSILQMRAAETQKNCFYRSSADIERPINCLTGWNWRSHEARLARVSAAFIHSLWSPMLRHCPVCLEAGFHSVWYQVDTLFCCPIHGCELVTVCQHAARQPRGTDFRRRFFAIPIHAGSAVVP
ncbi:TniQ family protein [Paraburkholderia sp. WC7.3g]|uniref:TniQ family protein n=1 Tax=Paraburkholderia sp. WC7.3g TaxID=2991070 RepID=UPI003D1B02D0